MDNRGRKIGLKLPVIPDSAEFPLLFLLIFLPSYLMQQPMPPGFFDSPVYQMQILMQSLLILSLTLYLLRKNPPPGKTAVAALAPEISLTAAGAVLAGLAVLFLIYNSAVRFLGEAGLPVAQNDTVLITRAGMLVPVLAVCAVSALMEEFFFRGYGYLRLLQAGMGPVPALILINILFAAGHVYEGGAAAVFAFLSGLLFSLALRRGVSLFSLSAAHGIFNFAMILISFFS